MKQNKVEIQATFRGVSDEGSYDFIITTESEDRHGTIFLADGWELESYRKNPVVFYNHNRGSEDPDMNIGSSTVRREGNDHIASLTFDDVTENKVAAKIKRKLDNGTLRSASIGAIPKEGKWEVRDERDVLVFSRQELLEWSVVDVPSNTDAIKRGYEDVIKSIDKPVEERNQNGMTILEAQLLINKQ